MLGDAGHVGSVELDSVGTYRAQQANVGRPGSEIIR
jgi:hypothetical protein